MLEELLVHAWMEGSVQDIMHVVIERAFQASGIMLEVRRR